MSTRVAIIGAGGAGLALCQCLQNEPQIDHIVYERAAWIGGTWRYTKNDKNAINTPMYKNLRTNLPKEVMAYPDFPFPKHLPSFIPTKEVGNYLESYASHFNLMKDIRLEHEVVSVKPKYQDEEKQLTWEVAVKNLRNNTIEINLFDAVVVCNGHFEVPRFPKIPGVDTFPGQVIHSVQYDKPEDFQDKVVAILGAKHSGVDICMDLSEFATAIYLIHFGEKSSTKYPKNVQEIIGTITALFSDGNVEISNGEKRRADAVILCTGYLCSFPFLDPECGVNVSAHNRVTPLYKHVFNIRYPSMSFIGLCRRVCPFPNYAVQAKWVCSVLTGRKTSPSEEEMFRDEETDHQQRLEAGESQNMMHVLAENQLQYCEMIADLAGEPCTYTPGIHSLYFHMRTIRAQDLATYKNKNFTIENDEWKEI